MEDDNLPPRDSTSKKNFTTITTAATSQSQDDAILQRKHAAMVERLTNLHQSRISQKPNSHLTSTTTESTQSFLTRFTQSKLSIESHLSRISQTTPSSESDTDTLKSDLQNVAVSISALEKLVAESSYYLPSYEVRTCLKTISDLKQSLDDVTSHVIPKKKFSFKNKKKSISTAPALRNDIVDASKNIPKSGIENVGFSGGLLESSQGFRAKENEILVREFDRVGEIGEFSVSNLKGCEVRLKGCLRAFFVNKLRDCRIYVGPVFGSALIEEVEGCVFVLASHQIRIHNARGCDFYLRVRSRPIIEDSSGLRFAPYCLRYNGIEKDLEKANLSEETGNWANVDDFRWLRAVQSPNWSVLPENERVETVDISEFGNVNGGQ